MNVARFHGIWWPVFEWHMRHKPKHGSYRRIRPHAVHPMKRPGKRRMRS